jgi:hypothetical protein
MLRRLAIATLLTLWLPACAAHPGIALGHAHVAAGRYRDAYASYQAAAVADPSDEEAVRLATQLRPYARDQATRQAEEALTRGDYEAAKRHARYVERLDPELGAELDARIGETLRASLEALLVSQRHDEAYPLAVRASRLYPHMRGLGTVFGRLRAHYRAESKRRAAAGDFEAALAALDVIERHEPALSGELEPERQALRERWADALVAEGAREHAAGRAGIATARYARAFAIAGREGDGDRMRRGLAELAPQGRFHLSLSVDGDRRRASRVAPMLETGLTGLQGVVLAENGQAVAMDTSVHLAPLTCAQRGSHRTESRDYVAGQRDVENPAWKRLSDDVADASRELDRHAASAERARAERQRASDDAQRCAQQKERPASDELAKAEGERERAEEKVERLQKKLEQLESGSDAAALEQARRKLERAQKKLDDARRDEKRARDKLEQARRRCDRKRGEVTRLDTTLGEARAKAQQARRKTRRLERERSATPPTIQEPIVETYRYRVDEHERSCGGSLVLSLERSWMGPERAEVRHERTTNDDSHAAHPIVDLARDPLEFPEDDASLQAGADADAAVALTEQVARNVKSYYGRIVDRAIALSEADPNGATSVLLAIAHVAPAHLTGERGQRLRAYLRREHGLASLDVLQR